MNLAPPPDLVVQHLTSPQKVVNGESVTISYNVMNDGFGSPFETTAWTDVLVSKIPSNSTRFALDIVYLSWFA